MFISALQAEKLKKKNNIQTYSEILAYMENKEIDTEKSKEERKHLRKTKGLMMLVSACVTLLLIGVGYIVFHI